MDSDKVNHCIEVLCLNGCDAVRATITSLETGMRVEAARDLDAEERAAVLRELKTIMAVYDDRDCHKN